MVMVQRNKETIFTFGGSTHFLLFLCFFHFFLNFFSMAGSRKCRQVKNWTGTPPPHDVSNSAQWNPHFVRFERFVVGCKHFQLCKNDYTN